MVPSSKAPLHSLSQDDEDEVQHERPSVLYVCPFNYRDRDKDDSTPKSIQQLEVKMKMMVETTNSIPICGGSYSVSISSFG